MGQDFLDKQYLGKLGEDRNRIGTHEHERAHEMWVSLLFRNVHLFILQTPSSFFFNEHSQILSIGQIICRPNNLLLSWPIYESILYHYVKVTLPKWRCGWEETPWPTPTNGFGLTGHQFRSVKRSIREATKKVPPLMARPLNSRVGGCKALMAWSLVEEHF